jgi:hypothetical protein
VKKPIKIELKNAAAIEAELKAVNGKAHQHTYTDYSGIADIAETAEKKLVGLVGAKSRAPGAVVYATSGASVANAYDYNRKGTAVRLERRASGWFLTSITEATIYKDGGETHLALTAQQDADAVAFFRRGYMIQPSAPHPTTAPESEFFPAQASE